MSLYRVVLFSLAAAFTVGMTSFASAGGWGWGSGWGSGFGCGGCAAPSAAVVYAQPVAPPPPQVVVGWTGGCGCGCGCGHQSIVYAAPPIEPTPIAPAPIYVVNQGPEYDGPGITVPYHTWTPASAYGPVTEYGYRHHHHFGYDHHYGMGYGFRTRPRFAFHEHHERFIGFPHRRWGTPMMPHRWYPWNK